MSLFKRALVQVRANVGKSLLIFLIFFMTMSAISATFIVTRMYTTTVNEVFKEGEVPVYIYPKEDVSAFGTVTYGVDEEYKQISPKQYDEIANLDSVVSSQKTISMGLGADQLQLPAELNTEMTGYEIYIQFTNDVERSMAGYGSDVYKLDYDKDEYKSNQNAIIINDEVLAANDLEVGDTVTLDLNPQTEQGSTPELENQELTIAGTYTAQATEQMIEDEKAYAAEYGYEPDLNFGYLKTDVFMPAKKGEEVLKYYIENPDALSVQVIYNLSSLDAKEQFQIDAEALLGYPLDVEFSLYDGEQNAKADAIATLAYFKSILGRIIKLIVLVIIVLLTVIITLFVRGRKKEIGILVALGETKRNIYSQLMIEQFILLGVATIIEYPIILTYLNIVLKKSELSASFDLLALGQSILAGILLVGIITIIPAVYTLRVKPKKILL